MGSAEAIVEQRPVTDRDMQLAVARALRDFVRIDLEIPAQRKVADVVREGLGFPKVGEVIANIEGAIDG